MRTCTALLLQMLDAAIQLDPLLLPSLTGLQLCLAGAWQRMQLLQRRGLAAGHARCLGMHHLDLTLETSSARFACVELLFRSCKAFLLLEHVDMFGGRSGCHSSVLLVLVSSSATSSVHCVLGSPSGGVQCLAACA